jgi:c-di-GMP-binding flagellar brake protein YcgR
MARKRQLPVHLAVELEIPDGPAQGRYPTRVLECEGDTISVALPLSGGEFATVRPGDRVTVEYIDRGGRYRLHTRVTAVTHEPPAAVTVGNPADVQCEQRRGFVRLAVSVPVTYAALSAVGPGGNARGVRVTRRTEGGLTVLAPVCRVARTRDLSGGGMMLAVEENLKAGEVLQFEFTVPGGPLVRGNAEVLRVEDPEPGDAPERPRRLVALRFLDLDDRLRDRIVAFLFAEEVRRWRAGLI